MSCDERQILIEQLLDGELPPSESSPLKKHIQKCQTCQLYFQKMQSEQSVFEKYNFERSLLDLPPQLWETIAQQLPFSENVNSSASARSWWLEMFKDIWISPRISPLAVAVLLIISIGLTVLFLRQQSGPDQSAIDIAKRGSEQRSAVTGPLKAVPAAPIKPAPVTPSRTKSGSNTTPQRTVLTPRKGSAVSKKLSPQELVKRAEESYQAAIRLLERDFKRRPNPLEDQTRQQFRLALAAIDKNIEDMRKAVQRYPEDPQTIQYLLTAYAKKVDLLEEMVSF